MRVVRLVGVMLATAVTCAGCVTAVGAPPAATDHRPAEHRSVGYERLTVVGFAGLGGRLAVRLRNDDARAVSAARAVIVARDRRGAVVAATSGPVGTPCCLLTDLPPGATAAVYADLGDVAVARVRSVQVTAVPLPRGSVPVNTREVVGDVALQTDGTGAVVRARVTSDPPAVVVVRAELVDTSGHIVTVAGTRVPCGTDAVTLDVGAPVPPQTVVRAVSVQAVGSC